jgi:hypothetical protein
VKGALNSPWSRDFELTTTSNEVEAQADAIRELIAQRQIAGCRRQFLVKPNLVVRGSTAPPR